jgi:hypothetical protein
MNLGRTVFSQLVDLLPIYQFRLCVDRYHGNRYVKDFSCWDQFVSLRSRWDSKTFSAVDVLQPHVGSRPSSVHSLAPTTADISRAPSLLTVRVITPA